VSDTYCNATGKEPIPKSLWIPSSSYRIYRGEPRQMVLEMAEAKEDVSVRKALQKLTKSLAQSRHLVIQLPWDESEEILSTLFLQALLTTRISQPVPLA
jgi:hypothetical protein